VLSGFIQAVTGYRDAALATADVQAAAYRVRLTQDLRHAGQILQRFTDDQIPPELPFVTLQARAFGLLERERLHHAATSMVTGAGYDETALFWQAIDAMHRRFKGRLRPLLCSVRLTASDGHGALMEAVAFLQDRFRRDQSLADAHAPTIPTRCIPVRLKRYLYTKSAAEKPELVRDRYEFLVYQRVRAALEAGEVCCPQRVRVRSIEDDRISIAEWNAHKAAYLAETQFSILQQPIAEHRAVLETDREAQFAHVNGRITSHEHTAVQITSHGTTWRWTLQTPKGRDPITHARSERLSQVALNDMLALIQTRGAFMDAFEHALGRYRHHMRDDRVLRAGLIAWGTNLGLARMGESSDGTTQTLVRTSEN
jgi:hypothetical protein